MTENEKDIHIAKLESHVQNMENVIWDLQVQIKAINSFLMDPDPTDPAKGSRAMRMMSATRFLEQCNWMVKILMYVSGVILGVGTVLSAAKGWFVR